MPPRLRLRRPGDRRAGPRTAWVVRNGRLDTEWSSTNRSILGITARSASTLLHFSAVNDITRIFLTTQRDGVAFRLAYIGSDFRVDRPEPFDTGFMRALFAHGQGLARNGYPWATRPPHAIVNPSGTPTN